MVDARYRPPDNHVLREASEDSDLTDIEQIDRRHSAALRRAESLAHVGSWEYDVDLDVLTISDGLRQIWGVSDGPVSIDSLAATAHADHRARVLEAMDRLVSEGKPFDETFMIAHGRTGEWRWFRGFGAASRSTTGRVTRAYGATQDITDVVERENALRKANAQLRNAERIGRFGSWELDTGAGIVKLSEGAAELYALESEVTAEDVLSLVHPDDIAQVRATYDRAVTTGAAFEIDYRVVVHDAVSWLRSKGESDTDAGGRVVKLIGSVKDVTRDKAREDQLRRAEKQSRTAEILGKFGAWELDIVTGQATFSKGAAETLGIPQDTSPDVVGALVHPDDVGATRSRFEEALSNGSRLEVEYRFRRPDGTIGWMRSIGLSERDASGRVIKMFGASQDITDEKGREAALQKSREDLKHFLDSLTGFTALLSPIGRILQVGGLAERAFATDGHELRDVLWQDAAWWSYDPEVHARVRVAFNKAALGERVRFTEQLLTKDGPRFFESVLTPVASEEGTVTSIVVEGYDVTDEERLRSTLAAERRQLARANEDLIAFNYTVTHDLKAPLRGIQAYLRALGDDHPGELSNSAQALIGKVSAEADRMGTIIHDLLTLARNSGRLQRENMDLTILALAVATELNGRETERSVRFVIEPGMIARADPTLVRILLQNLMGNAWKFTRREPNAVIEVGVENAGGEAVFFVKDNGVGFDGANDDGLFSPFKRYHAPAEYEGTGVGLATVRRIVDAHGGRIWADSRPGEGATFWFTLSPHGPEGPVNPTKGP